MQYACILVRQILIGKSPESYSSSIQRSFYLSLSRLDSLHHSVHTFQHKCMQDLDCSLLSPKLQESRAGRDNPSQTYTLFRTDFYSAHFDEVMNASIFDPNEKFCQLEGLGTYKCKYKYIVFFVRFALVTILISKVQNIYVRPRNSSVQLLQPLQLGASRPRVK